jgi:DNA-directed RNA polymerase subunit beta
MPETIKQISFAKLDQGMNMPHLLDIQTRAFEALLQLDASSHDREDIGLERVFKDLFPITDVHENFSLEFVRYSLGEPKYTVEECIERDMTYSAPLKATLQLVINEVVNEQKRPRNIIEKEVYLGELPLLTPLGTFVINGAERVIVSQLHRSPGVVFEESTHPNGQRLISARIIPFRGSWVEFTVDIHDVVYVHIDKKKKFPATALLRAFGYGSNSDILRLFFAVRDLDLTKKRESRLDVRELLGAIIAEDIALPGEATAEDAPKARTKKAKAEREASENVLLVKEGDELTETVYNRLRRQNIDTIKVFASHMKVDLRDEQDAVERGERPVRRQLALDVVDADGEVIAEVGQNLTDTIMKKIRKADITKVSVFVASGRAESTLIKNTLAKDPTHSEKESLGQIYALLRPGDAPDAQTAKQALERLVLLAQALRPRPRRPVQDQSAARHEHAGRLHGAVEGRFCRDHSLPRRVARGPRACRRHRPPRQPAYSFGRRVDRQPVLGRLEPHGAPGEGAHVDQHRSGKDLARRPGECAYGERRHSGVLRIVAAVTVHGPDESARRVDAQASSVGARTGRSYA